MPKNNLLDFRCVVWYLFVLKKNTEEGPECRGSC